MAVSAQLEPLGASGFQVDTVRARFSEIVTGVPVLDEWELTNRFRAPRLPRIEVGQVFNVQWMDSTAVKPDQLPPRPGRGSALGGRILFKRM